MKTAYQYIRISNEDQSNFSISGQKMLNEDWARKNNIRIVETFVDEGYSAKDFNRPQWKTLEGSLSKNKVDYLIISKYDRLIRNVIEGLVFVEKLEQKWNITLISVMENYSIDIHDPYFFKHRADMFVDADFERRRISDRTKMGIWSGKTQGRFLGKAPYGYTNGRDKNDKPIILINPDQQKVIESIFTDFIDDVPMPDLKMRAVKKGFNMRGKESIKRIIFNHVYAGLVPVKAYKADVKKIVKGIHEPIVSEELFWQAYYKLEEKINPEVHKILDDNLPLRGFLQCENCNNVHTGAKCKGKNSYYYYYWCNKCRGKNYNAKQVHLDMATILNALSLKNDVIEAIRIDAKKKIEVNIKEKDHKLAKVNRDQAEINKKLSSLEEKYIMNKISDSAYQKWHLTFSKELNTIAQSISFLQTEENVMLSLFDEKIEYLSDLNLIYNMAPIEDKHIYLKDIFPGGLYPKIGCSNGSLWSYRTPYLNNLFLPNALSLGALLEVKKEGESSSLGKFPVRVDNGKQIEHLLNLSHDILKRCA